MVGKTVYVENPSDTLIRGRVGEDIYDFEPGGCLELPASHLKIIRRNNGGSKCPLVIINPEEGSLAAEETKVSTAKAKAANADAEAKKRARDAKAAEKALEARKKALESIEGK